MNEREFRQRCATDFRFYASRLLRIRSKNGVMNLNLNSAQEYVYKRIEEIRRQEGMIRVILLKGRQQGMSTFVQALFLWLVMHNKGMRAYILTHDESATRNLYEITKRYYDNLPEPMKPGVSTRNSRELLFDGMDSGYKVGTAGNKGVGRSDTAQLFHGSEVAYWSHAEDHATGALQIVPDVQGSAIILESTANGVGNYFHEQWQQAEREEGRYKAIFVPWFWQQEYKMVVPEGFVLDDEELDLSRYYNLTMDQLYWRRMKVKEFSTGGLDGRLRFAQEYPCTASEAFQVTGISDTLIKASASLRARKATVKGEGILRVGVDPSHGGDAFCVIRRQGRRAYGTKCYNGGQVDTLSKRVSICKEILDTVDKEAGKVPDIMFIDYGYGADIVDVLNESGYKHRIKVVNFGGVSLSPRYKNKRSEMWGEMAKWVNDEDFQVDIEDNDLLQSHLNASPYDIDSNDAISLWHKKMIKKRFGVNPGLGDALALTFASGKVNTTEFKFVSPW